MARVSIIGATVGVGSRLASLVVSRATSPSGCTAVFAELNRQARLRAR